MIARNEEEVISHAISSAWLVADEIVVVDTGSTDATFEIAQSLGARCFRIEWKNDFAAARNESLRHARYEWVLWIDADERISVDSIQKIRELKSGPRNCVYGFGLHNVNPTNLEFIGDMDFLQSKMFLRLPNIRFEKRIHEQVTPSALRAGLRLIPRWDIVIEHHGYRDPAIVDKKLKRNICLMLIDMGFPEDAEFIVFDIANCHCFFAPSVLSVWLNNKPIGFCNPFDTGLPDSLQKQNETMMVRALQIIQHYQSEKEHLGSDRYQTILMEIERLERAYGLTQQQVTA